MRFLKWELFGHLKKIKPASFSKKTVVIIGFAVAVILSGALLSSSFVSDIPLVGTLLNRGQVEEAFEIKDASPRAFQTTFPVVGEPTFVFSKKLRVREEDLSKYVSISPAVEGSWHLSKDRYVIYFSSDKTQKDRLVQMFPSNATYKITISQGLQAVGGEKLKEDKSILFRTAQNPGFKLGLQKKLIAAQTGKPVKIELYNIPDGSSPYTLTLHEATPEQLISYFTRSDQAEFVYMLEGVPKKLKSMSKSVTVDSESSNSFIELDPLEAGIYYVSISNSYGSEDLFISSSSYVAQSAVSSDELRVWVSDTAGKSISDFSVSAYSLVDTVRLLGSEKSGVDGVASFPFTDATLIVTEIKNQYAFTYLQDSWFARMGRLEVFSQTDRPVYRPGDVVHYKAVIRSRENGSYVVYDKPVYVKMEFGYSNSDDSYIELQPDVNGTVIYDFTLPEMTQQSYFVINLALKTDEEYFGIDTREVKVESYRKPNLDITLSTSDIEYVSRDTATLQVVGKTLYGSPMANLDFSYRVIANKYSEMENRSYEQITSDAFGYYGDGRELSSGTGTLNASGTAQITFSTDLQDLEDSQVVTVEVSPKIAASPSIETVLKLVHRGEYALFINRLKSDAELGIQGAVRSLNHSQKRQPVSGKEITLQLYRVENYDNKEFISEQKVITDSAGTASFSFDEKNIGSYEIVARGNDNRGNTITTRSSTYISKRSTTQTSQNQKQILLKTDKEEQTPQDRTNTLRINTEFRMNDVAVAIVRSSESEKRNNAAVYSFEIIGVNGNSHAMPYTIPEGDLPYTIQVYTVIDGEVVTNSISVDENRTHKEISTSVSFNIPVAAPGQNVSMTIETKDRDGKPVAADNAVAVIDSAILQIGKIGDRIFDAFFKDRGTPYLRSFDSSSGIFKDRNGLGGGCFLSGTEILTETGSKPIERVSIGDVIRTRASDFDKTLVSDAVTHVHRQIVDEYWTINGTLHITPVHMIFLNSKWRIAGSAQIGDMLTDQDGNQVRVHSIDRHVGQFEVFNLTTQNTHTFIADGFYVHNEKGDSPRQHFADTAYWNPHIQTDADGKATVEIKLPDNITTYTTQVYSNTGASQFGQATTELIAKRDVVLIPVLGNYYFQDDKPVVGAVVQNSTKSRIKGEVKLYVPELSIEQSHEVDIEAGAYTEVQFPIAIGKTEELTFQLDLRDSGGKELDSVSEKKQIFPHGSINASWESFEGSKDIVFEPQYPKNNLNALKLQLVPHVAKHVMGSSVGYMLSNDYSMKPSVDTGLNMYVAARILGFTGRERIPSNVYEYAQLKNNLRQTVDAVLASRSTLSGRSPWKSDNADDSDMSISLMVLKGFDETILHNLVPDLANSESLLSEIRKSIVYDKSQASVQDELLRGWVLGVQSDCIDTACLAAEVISGQNGVRELIDKRIKSADDRFIWTSVLPQFSALPALAAITEGTADESDKAVIGLSFQSVYFDQLAMLAGVEHAVRNALPWKMSETKVSISDFLIFEESEESLDFSDTFSPALSADGSVKIQVKSEKGLPMYGTISMVEYGFDTSEIGNGIRIDTPIRRKMRSLPEGAQANAIENGQAGIVELSFENPYSNLFSDYSGISSIFLVDSVSPQYMILNQTSGNSPQYGSVFDSIYSQSSYSQPYINFSNYSDQFVQFDGNTQAPLVVLPYSVWNITEGQYFQPKTSVIYPKLGIILEE